MVEATGVLEKAADRPGEERQGVHLAPLHSPFPAWQMGALVPLLL